jgi:hypothetical protein
LEYITARIQAFKQEIKKIAVALRRQMKRYNLQAPASPEA